MAVIIALIVVAVVVVLIVVWLFAIYNGLVRLRNQTKNAWAQIDVQLKSKGAAAGTHSRVINFLGEAFKAR